MQAERHDRLFSQDFRQDANCHAVADMGEHIEFWRCPGPLGITREDGLGARHRGATIRGIDDASAGYISYSQPS